MRYLHCAIWKGNNFLAGVVIILILNAGIFLPGLYGYAIKDKDLNLAWTRKGYLKTRVYQDAKDDTPFEKQEDIDARFRIDNRIELKNLDALLEINLEARGEALINEKTNKDADFLLKEAYLEIKKPGYTFSFGRQTITWGKLDDVVILDRISPQEYNRFILYDKQERKLPELMLKFDYFLDNCQLEGVFLPLFKASKLKFFGSDWAVYDHLIESIQYGDYSGLVKNTIGRIKLEEKDRLKENTAKNAQFGLRLSGRLKDVDCGIYYMNIYQDMPTLREKTPVGNAVKRFLNHPTDENLASLVGLNPTDEDLTLIEEHPRVQVIGVDGEGVLGNFGARGEAGLFLGQPYLRGDFSYVRKNSVSMGLGIDHTTSNNIYFNLQVIQSFILNYEPLFPDEEYTQQITSTLTKDFLNGSLIFKLKDSYNLSYNDWMINPKITYKFNNGLEASLAGFIFEGGITTLFGRYTNKDLIYLEVEYKF